MEISCSSSCVWGGGHQSFPSGCLLESLQVLLFLSVHIPVSPCKHSPTVTSHMPSPRWPFCFWFMKLRVDENERSKGGLFICWWEKLSLWRRINGLSFFPLVGASMWVNQIAFSGYLDEFFSRFVQWYHSHCDWALSWESFGLFYSCLRGTMYIRQQQQQQNHLGS